MSKLEKLKNEIIERYEVDKERYEEEIIYIKGLIEQIKGMDLNGLVTYFRCELNDRCNHCAYRIDFYKCKNNRCIKGITEYLLKEGD